MHNNSNNGPEVGPARSVPLDINLPDPTKPLAYIPREIADMSRSNNYLNYLSGTGSQSPQIQAGSGDTISDASGIASFVFKIYRKVRGISRASQLYFNNLPTGFVSVSAPPIPAGSKLQFRLDQYIPGTRYAPGTLATTTAHSLLWKAASGLRFSLATSVGINAIDYGIGEHADKGIGSKEFFASTMVDFGIAGLTGFAAAGIVGLIIASLPVTVPLAVAVGATAIVGVGLGFAINDFFAINQFKQMVTDGITAWGGNFENIKTITQVGADRVSNAVRNATDRWANGFSNLQDLYEITKTNLILGAERTVETIRNTAENVVNTGKQAVEAASESIGEFSEKVGDSAREVVETMTNTIQQVSQGVSNVIGQATQKASEFLGGLFGGIK
jgi:hypothetical protein